MDAAWLCYRIVVHEKDRHCAPKSPFSKLFNAKLVRQWVVAVVVVVVGVRPQRSRV